MLLLLHKAVGIYYAKRKVKLNAVVKGYLRNMVVKQEKESRMSECQMSDDYGNE